MAGRIHAEIENEIINKLSKSLKSELIFESYGQILKNAPLFFANFSEKFLGELMCEIKEVRNIPEDSIFKQNQTDECEIFFIIKGKVELYYTFLEDENSNDHKIQILKANFFFLNLKMNFSFFFFIIKNSILGRREFR